MPGMKKLNIAAMPGSLMFAPDSDTNRATGKVREGEFVPSCFRLDSLDFSCGKSRVTGSMKGGCQEKLSLAGCDSIFLAAPFHRTCDPFAIIPTGLNSGGACRTATNTCIRSSSP